MPEVSVVLISKNQEWNIARLIESVLRETEHIPGREVVLVDSASTDRTVDIARQYPVNIIRLHPGQHLSSHAGRYTGYRHSTGDFILFLDGDMELYPGWLEKALHVFHTNPTIAMVTGQRIDLLKTATDADKPPLEDRGEAWVEVDHGGGAAMYRRAVLDEVGPFNPYFYSDGEPELCIRIRYRGYNVVQLHHIIDYHYSEPEWALHNLVGRWKRNMYQGYGQGIRYHLGNETFWPYLRERGFGCVPMIALAIGLFSLAWSATTRRWLWFRLWVGLLVAAIAAHAYRERSIYQTTAALLNRILVIDGTIRGFLHPPLPPDSYQPQIDIVKWVGDTSDK
jgi:glycosyltransferase involved in cell wall biosynthesis